MNLKIDAEVIFTFVNCCSQLIYDPCWLHLINGADDTEILIGDADNDEPSGIVVWNVRMLAVQYF